MKSSDIPVKTDAGNRELSLRAHKLSPRVRSLLIVIHAWCDGIAAAGRAGDVQAQKEMQVFVKRLDKHAGNTARD